MKDRRTAWALALLIGLPVTVMAADRAARFREYDARRMEALRKTAEGSGLESATARLYLNKDVDQANRIVMEAEFAKIYWANNVTLIPLYEMFNADTGTRSKLLSREATDKILAYLWQCFQPEGKAGGHIARHYHFFPDQPWLYWGNQNHGFVYQSLFYTAAKALKDIPKYADQFDPARHVPLGAGVDDLKDHPELAKITLADYAERARQMWRSRLLWMAQQGLWAEDMIYRLSNVEGTYNLAYHDGDAAIRKRAEMILDLHWLLYALQTVDWQFGGAQNRFKPHYAGYHPERGTGWYYFGGRPGTQPCMAALLGDYIPPEIAYQLLENQDKRGCFVRRERLTQFSPEVGQPPHVYKYSYTTPEYVLGSYIAHHLASSGAAADPQGQVIGRYAERAFNGLAFGKARAILRLGPAVSFQSYHCMQNGPILLFRWYGQELVGADSPWGKRVGNPQPYASIIPREGGGVETRPAAIEGGWLFGQAGDAWFAMRPAEGQCTINAEKKQFEWPEWKMPLVLHAGGATEDGSFESFKKKILANRLTYENGVLTYSDAKWGTMQFCPDSVRPADQWRRIDGKPVPLPDKLFDSPYMTSDYNSGIVAAQFNGSRLVLDFNKAERIETPLGPTGVESGQTFQKK